MPLVPRNHPPGRAFATLSSKFDERLERGRRIAAAGIVEAQGRQGGGPVLENTDQPAGIQVVPHVGFHREGEADRGKGGGAGEARFIKGEGALHIDLDRLSALLERPAVEGAIGKTHAKTGVVHQVLRDLRRPARRQIGG